MKIRPTTGKKRENSIPLKASDDEKEILEIAAALKGMHVSHFIANCALKEACTIVSVEFNKNYDYILSRIRPLITEEEK